MPGSTDQTSFSSATRIAGVSGQLDLGPPLQLYIRQERSCPEFVR